MNKIASARLKEMTARHGRELFNQSRRAEIVRENLGPDCKLEASALNAAAQQGIPQRLLAMPAGHVTSTALANAAAQMAAQTGLKDDIAYWAVATWASAFGLIGGGVPERQPRPGSGRSPAPAAAPVHGRVPLAQLPTSPALQLVGGGLAAQSLVAISFLLWPASADHFTVFNLWAALSRGTQGAVNFAIFALVINLITAGVGIGLILQGSLLHRALVRLFGYFGCAVGSLMFLALVVGTIAEHRTATQPLIVGLAGISFVIQAIAFACFYRGHRSQRTVAERGSDNGGLGLAR